MTKPEPTYDFVVYGATSFVGRLLVEYLLERYGANRELRWAVAGRSHDKLSQLCTEMEVNDLPLIVADAHDQAALQALCDQTRAVVSTVGPYALHGSTLVGVCAETGTDYCDLTGEVPWIHQMMTAHSEQAAASGARIIHCCGFDSIPSDMGVWFVQQAMQQRFGACAQRIRMRVQNLKGSLSGGTVASMMNMAGEARRDADIRRRVTDPYALVPAEQRPQISQPKVPVAQWESETGQWAAPFIMGSINMPVVHRSNALMKAAYGSDFCYDEAMCTGQGWRGQLRARAMTYGTGAFMAAAAFNSSRWLLERFVVPASGSGPGPEARANGFFDLRFYGKSPTGDRLSAKVTGDRDPGYGATSRMLGESVVALATQTPQAEVPGGFWTPASAWGGQLIERLVDNAGMAFEVLD